MHGGIPSKECFTILFNRLYAIRIRVNRINRSIWCCCILCYIITTWGVAEFFSWTSFFFDYYFYYNKVMIIQIKNYFTHPPVRQSYMECGEYYFVSICKWNMVFTFRVFVLCVIISHQHILISQCGNWRHSWVKKIHV